MLLSVIAIILGLALLVWGAERFISGAAALARNLGVSPMLIGLTIVGFGTSAPEILVSATAALKDSPGLAIGNAIGSNIANIGLILGVTALIQPLLVHSSTLRREYPVLLIVTLGTLLLMLNGTLGRMDRVVLLLGLVATLYFMYRLGLASRVNDPNDPMGPGFDAEIPRDLSTRAAVGWFIAGLAVLLLSSHILVWGAVNIATAFGVSELVIGLTIIALGTSLPELAACVAGALKNEHDIAIGNIIGSNLYNLLAVLAMPALLAPSLLDPAVLLRDMPVMIALTLALFVMGYGVRSRGEITRMEGMVLVAAYLGYQGYLFSQLSGTWA